MVTFWRELIAEVREIYSGPLSYAANWDSYARVPFWKELDYVGVQAYFPLSDADDPSYEELLDAWQAPVAAMQRVARKVSRPLLLAEVGYTDSPGAAARPWESERGDRHTTRIQERCLRAALATAARTPEIAGAFVWKWFPTTRSVGPGDFTVQTDAFKFLARSLVALRSGKTLNVLLEVDHLQSQHLASDKQRRQDGPYHIVHRLGLRFEPFRESLRPIAMLQEPVRQSYPPTFQHGENLKLHASTALSRFQTGSYQLAIIANSLRRRPHHRQRIAGQNMRASQFEQPHGILRVGLVLLTLGRLGDVGRTENEALNALVGKQVVQPVPLAGSLVDENDSRTGGSLCKLD